MPPELRKSESSILRSLHRSGVKSRVRPLRPKMRPGDELSRSSVCKRIVRRGKKHFVDLLCSSDEKIYTTNINENFFPLLSRAAAKFEPQTEQELIAALRHAFYHSIKQKDVDHLVGSYWERFQTCIIREGRYALKR